MPHLAESWHWGAKGWLRHAHAEHVFGEGRLHARGSRASAPSDHMARCAEPKHVRCRLQVHPKQLQAPALGVVGPPTLVYATLLTNIKPSQNSPWRCRGSDLSLMQPC
jgi:hypothetical protein